MTLLAIDAGTTSSRAILFDLQGRQIATHQIEFQQHYPNDGWVEHAPEEIWQTTLLCCRMAIERANIDASEVTAIGISNQRETTVIWDRATGQPIYPAIVWQDRRTALQCQELSKDAALVTSVQEKTGLLLDSYFSATKIAWILDNVDSARLKAQKGQLAFGTIDSFILWNLTGGQVHATDATNASRTLLFNIRTQEWDEELLKLFNIPKSMLPEVKDSNAHFGVTDRSLLGVQIPITGIAGDQQAATVGQSCFQSGMIKSTYGTGCFVLLNTGKKIVQSHNRLLSTVAYRIDGDVCYGLEGSIFNAGTAIKWLRDQLHLFAKASDTQALAESIDSTRGVYFVPAFTGLGAPYWQPDARGMMCGLSRDSGIADIVRAALEAVCYQTRDLMQAMSGDYQGPLATLRVDGGMVINDWLLQFLADILQLPVERPTRVETSAWGAALLAGLGVGVYQSLDDVAQLWQHDADFHPIMHADKAEQFYLGWRQAVARTI